MDPDREFLRTLKILFVEDDATTRKLLRTFLERRLGEVVDAADGAEGLARFEVERPQLVLTDIQMPVMDGLSMAAQIRLRGEAVPIIVATEFEEVAYLKRSIDLGVDRYVTKPIDGAQLEAALLAVARRLRAEASLEREHQRQLQELRSRRLEALGLLAGGMAHDFNNLLQSISSSVGLAVSLAPAGSKLHQLLRIAEESANQASTLGRHLMLLAGTRPPLARAPIAPIVERALRGAVGASAVRLQLRLAGELPEIEVHGSLLERAFGEIARNARDAMPEGGALVVTGGVRLLREGEVPPLAAGRYVELAFQDEGRGIAPELLPKIFDPYFSTKERGAVRGLGLGLALCLAIVHQHRGQVTAESPPSAGAIFRVFLPIDAGAHEG